MRVELPPIKYEAEAVPVVKARVGWWVDGRWCPTKRICERELRAAHRRRREKELE